VNIGSAGASSWDFSALRSDSSFVLTSVAVGSTPYAAEFPGATHALRAEVSLEGISGTAYVYVILGPNLLNPGIMAGPPEVPGFIVKVKITNLPADVTYALPSTFGTTWTSVYTETISFLVNGSPTGAPTVTNYDVSYSVDGYGPMTIPGGTTHDALRIKKTSRKSSGTSIAYLFLAEDGALVQVSAADTLQPTSGTVQVSAISWAAATTTSVQTEEGVPARFALLQNAPNPFNPSTRIYFDLPVRSHVTLKVYTAIGQEVATVVDGPVEAGRSNVEFDASSLPSGLYLYRLQTDGFVQTKKMMLLK
jgi:hypothetical protein